MSLYAVAVLNEFNNEGITCCCFECNFVSFVFLVFSLFCYLLLVIWFLLYQGKTATHTSSRVSWSSLSQVPSRRWHLANNSSSLVIDLVNSRKRSKAAFLSPVAHWYFKYATLTRGCSFGSLSFFPGSLPPKINNQILVNIAKLVFLCVCALYSCLHLYQRE